MRGARPQIHKGQTCHDGAQDKTETMNPRIDGPDTSHRPWLLLRHRRRGAILRTLRVLRPVAVRNTPRCWRGTLGKANVSLPFAIVVSVCHLYRLVSCITRPSYKKDVQQMRTYAKTSVSGMDGSGPGAIKRHPPRAIESRHQNGHSQRVAPLAVRPKNGAVRCTVLPSVELQAELLRQGRILKPRNKRARQNRPRKG